MSQKIRKPAAYLLLFLSFFLASCSTAVQITTEPSGADVELNGQVKGKTPLNLPLSDFVGSSYQVRFKKDGFKEKYVELQKEFKTGTFIGGLFLWPFLLWCYGPAPDQHYVLELEK